MTTVPLVYTLRNLSRRALATSLIGVGIGLAAFVVAVLLMAAAGLARTLHDSGSPANAVFVRMPATSESRSVIARDDIAALEVLPGIARGAGGERLAAREVVVPVALMPRPGQRGTPALLRGTDGRGAELRGQPRLAAGTMPRTHTADVVLGAALATTLRVTVGEDIVFGTRAWRVAGTFAASDTALDSEVWGDVDVVMASFRRDHYSSLLVRMDDPGALATFARALAQRPRSELAVYVERDFYAGQAQSLSRFLKSFAAFMGALLAVGAIAAGMIGMHAAVAQRTRELATLRALGFEASSILVAVLTEAAAIGLAGGALAIGLALCLGGVSFTTLNIETSTSLAFALLPAPPVLGATLAFALALGVAGGLAPAIRATRLEVATALREAG
jgi:ABC-type antimicrobial peptide transport system permease subunit